jgi:holo-ACP synthase/triphosphoribosyl-dephospho-CoA synthase
MDELLSAREARAHHVRTLHLMSPKSTVVLIKTNQPGPDKNPPYASFLRRTFDAFLLEAYQDDILTMGEASSTDGDYRYYRIARDPKTIKRWSVDLEDNHALGRLIDIDVYGPDALSRVDLGHPPRRCLVCASPAHLCVRSRAHDLATIQAVIDAMVRDHLIDWLTNESVAAIERELTLYPKFGLVSIVDAGCHTDMDITTFHASTEAIVPYLKRFVEAGCEDVINPLLLQAIGRDAEAAMFQATGGVNTQKGLIFLLGLFLPAIAHVLRFGESLNEVSHHIRTIAKVVIGDYYEALSQDTSHSHGDDVYLTYGIRGIRAQALDGLAVLFDIPRMETRDRDMSDHQYLIELMARIDDTTIIHKNDLNTLLQVRRDMRQLLDQGGYHANRDAVLRLSDTYKQRRISPGGSADLLVIKILLEELRPYIKEET